MNPYTWEEIEHERPEEDVAEKLRLASPPSFLLFLSAESVHESTCDQVLWPQHTGGLDGQPTTEAGHFKPGHIVREDHQNLVPKPVLDTVVLPLDYEHVGYIRGHRGDTSHNAKERVFLYIPWARVER